LYTHNFHQTQQISTVNSAKERAWSTKFYESETIKIDSLEEELWKFEFLEWMYLIRKERKRRIQRKIAFEYNLSKVGVE
jgi:hypothetical protein